MVCGRRSGQIVVVGVTRTRSSSNCTSRNCSKHKDWAQDSVVYSVEVSRATSAEILEVCHSKSHTRHSQRCEKEVESRVVDDAAQPAIVLLLHMAIKQHLCKRD